jgi:L-malate glycosyltransferase
MNGDPSRRVENRTHLKRLKVLFVTEWYPTAEQPVGGVFVREHAKAVTRFDDVVVLHIAGEDPTLKRFWQMKQEADRSLTEGVPTFRIWYRRPPLKKTKYLFHTIAAMKGIHKIMSEGFRPDVIHAHVCIAGMPSILLGKAYRIPVVITEHSSIFHRGVSNWPKSLVSWFFRFVFRNADLVLPVSHALQIEIERYGVRARFQIVPNVVDFSLFSSPGHIKEGDLPKQILFVGLLVPVKGVPHLLQALGRLRKTSGDWLLDIVGDGAARTEYERLTMNLNIGDKVTFHGLKSKEEVATFMRRADFLVLPSLWENFPCVLLEAMASGLPIVSTQAGGIPEIVDEEIGILVPPGDVNKLAEGLSEMMQSLPRFDRSAITKRADAYRPEVVGRLIHSLYESCVRR